MIVGDREHLGFEWLVWFSGWALVSDGKDFIDEKFKQMTVCINFLKLFIHFVERKEDGDGFRGEEVGVHCWHVEHYYLNLKIS